MSIVTLKRYTSSKPTTTLEDTRSECIERRVSFNHIVEYSTVEFSKGDNDKSVDVDT